MASEYVAVQTKLKAKVTPAGIAGLTYQWTVGGTRIKTYEHDVDEDAKHNPIALAAADLQNDNVAFYWQAVGNPIAVKVKATKGAAKHEATVNFNVTNMKNAFGDPDSNKMVYARGGKLEKYNPNGVGKAYDILESHRNWHNDPQMKMDNGDVPVFPQRKAAVRIPGVTEACSPRPTMVAPFSRHRAFIDSHLAWRGTFNQGAIGGACRRAARPRLSHSDSAERF